VLQEYLNSLTVMLNILGLIPDVKPLLPNEKELLLQWREARKNKDFALADEIRQKITELGIKF
jgi:cysteinyl-tRNA synthetase